jgi:uncharacterized protein (DUF1800 family)
MDTRKQHSTVTLSRRKLLQLSLAAAALAACNRMPGGLNIISHDQPPAATSSPVTSTTASSTSTASAQQAPIRQPSLDWLAASRLMFGPGAGDLSHIDQIGIDSFIEEQLAQVSDEDANLQTKLQQLGTLGMSAYALTQLKPQDILLELQRATLLRAVYSKRQLNEVMVDFWSNHFSIYFHKDANRFLKPIDDRDVIRPHALGKFRDLLDASAHSPAMLVFLDNVTNRKGSPNENYARELMELHTISVNGGYSQNDVKEVARALTGWTVRGAKSGGPDAGTFIFNSRWHDNDTKTILGQLFAPNGGQSDGDKVLDLLAKNPNCATFISTKMARRFISDQPPATAVLAGVSAFNHSDGDIKATLSAILHSSDFKQSYGQKLKRPLDLVASSLRALNADTDAGAPLQNLLTLMGQPLFLWPSPDGYPDVNGAWVGAGAMLARWNLGMALGANALPGTHIDPARFTSQSGVSPIDDISSRFFGASLPQSVVQTLTPFENDLPKLIALLLASPLFQIRG